MKKIFLIFVVLSFSLSLSLAGMLSGDNLGSHRAIRPLNMNRKNLYNSATIQANVDNSILIWMTPWLGTSPYGYAIVIGSNCPNVYTNSVVMAIIGNDNYDNASAFGYDTQFNYQNGSSFGSGAKYNYDGGAGFGNGSAYNYLGGCGFGLGTEYNWQWGFGGGAYSTNNYNFGTHIGAFGGYFHDGGSGLGAFATGSSSSVVVGFDSHATGDKAIVMGAKSTATVEAVTIGYGIDNQESHTVKYNSGYKHYISSIQFDNGEYVVGETFTTINLSTTDAKQRLDLLAGTTSEHKIRLDLLAGATQELRTDLTTESNTRATQDALIGGTTQELRTDLTSETNNRLTHETLTGGATQELRTDVNSKVNRSGDVMTGGLSAPYFSATSSITANLIVATTIYATEMFVTSKTYTVQVGSYTEVDYIYPNIEDRVRMRGDLDFENTYNILNNPEITSLQNQDALIGGTTQELRADLTTETNNRISADNNTAVSTSTLRTDLTTETNNRLTHEALVGSATQEIRTDITNLQTKDTEIAGATYYIQTQANYNRNKIDLLATTTPQFALESSLGLTRNATGQLLARVDLISQTTPQMQIEIDNNATDIDNLQTLAGLNAQTTTQIALDISTLRTDVESTSTTFVNKHNEISFATTTNGNNIIQLRTDLESSSSTLVNKDNEIAISTANLQTQITNNDTDISNLQTHDILIGGATQYILTEIRLAGNATGQIQTDVDSNELATANATSYVLSEVRLIGNATGQIQADINANELASANATSYILSEVRLTGNATGQVKAELESSSSTFVAKHTEIATSTAGIRATMESSSQTATNKYNEIAVSTKTTADNVTNNFNLQKSTYNAVGKWRHLHFSGATRVPTESQPAYLFKDEWLANFGIFQGSCAFDTMRLSSHTREFNYQWHITDSQFDNTKNITTNIDWYTTVVSSSCSFRIWITTDTKMDALTFHLVGSTEAVVMPTATQYQTTSITYSNTVAGFVRNKRYGIMIERIVSNVDALADAYIMEFLSEGWKSE